MRRRGASPRTSRHYDGRGARRIDEPPKPKTKHKLDISSKEDYDKLFQREQAYFGDMVAHSVSNFKLCFNLR